MKTLAILLLSAFSLAASAQSKTSSYKTNDTKQSVSDDGKTLHIMIKSNKDGKAVKYDRTFPVVGLNQIQKDVMLKKITDSLGIYPPPAPPAPASPAPHMPTSASTKNSSHSETEEKTVKDDGKTLHIMVSSTKGGKEVNYDKTFPVKGMSKQQKDTMVKKITDSLGVSK